MKYVVLYQGRVVWGPREWDPLSIENTIEMYVPSVDVVIGADPIVGRIDGVQDTAILRVESEDIPSHESLFETLEGPFYQNNIIDGTTKITWNVVPDHFPYVLGRIKQEVETKRYQKETEGIDIDVGGTRYRFPTDREQRNRLLIQSVTGEPVCWKIAGAWIDLSAEQLTTIVKQINAHVQKWFAWERTKIELIESCTTVEQVKQLYTTIVKED